MFIILTYHSDFCMIQNRFQVILVSLKDLILIMQGLDTFDKI